MNDEHGFDKNLQLFSHIQILSSVFCSHFIIEGQGGGAVQQFVTILTQLKEEEKWY